jgi:hypothetical protein
MKRDPLRRTTPLRSGAPPQRRTPLARKTPLRPGPWSRSGNGAGGAPMAASDNQRAKIVRRWCIVCQQTKGITPAHLTPRSLGGCDDADCVVPLCWMHHRAYDTGRLDLLPHLDPRRRAEIAHAVLHLGLIGAYRRLAGADWRSAQSIPKGWSGRG